jgi:sulfite exporter TauE/SafE
MSAELMTLLLTTVLISFVHTASGPDHYLPFIVFSRTRKWSLATTVFWTTACGIGHVLSSVLIGMIGVLLGWQLSKLDFVQGIRGDLASWSLLILGAFYLVWGLVRAYQNKPHKHFDVYDGDDIYVYTHRHGETVRPSSRIKVTPYILLAIFVMGPSEPIVPLLFYSGVTRSIFEISLLISVFTVTTVATMLGIVLLGYFGQSFVRTDKLERFSHAIGGAVVTLSGVGMVFWDW